MADRGSGKSAPRSIEVVCLGIIVADVVVKPVSGLPAVGDTGFVDYFNMHNGGDASNVAVNLAKLGIPTGILCKVGADPFGRFLVELLERQGVDTSHVLVDTAASTATCLVLVRDDGERSFFYKGDANDRLVAGDVDLDYVCSGRILNVGGTLLLAGLDGEPLARILAEARRRATTTSMDVCWDRQGRWLRTLEPCLEHLDIFLPSIEEARELAGTSDPEAIARRFLDYGVRIVGVKLGRDGAYITDGTDAFHVPAVQGIQIVDTTGAGDAFVAGFLAGRLQGWGIERAARFASAVSAACIQSVGTTTWRASFDELVKLSS
jgi:sugar/nucleoside kinase (ribokinase family)